MLERYKNVHAIADAWRLAAPCIPEASLRIVGDGRHRGVVEALVREPPAGSPWDRRLETPDVVKAFDNAWLLLLASRSEGTPRSCLEALCRGGPSSRSSRGIPDVVWDGETGLLVDPDRPGEIADALVRILSHRALAERLGAEGKARSSAWVYTPEEYADSVVELVERAVEARAA